MPRRCAIIDPQPPSSPVSVLSLNTSFDTCVRSLKKHRPTHRKQSPPKMNRSGSPSASKVPEVPSHAPAPFSGGSFGRSEKSYTDRHRIFFFNGHQLASPLHEIPLQASGGHVRMMCLTPAGSDLHREFAINEPSNPIRLCRDGDGQGNRFASPSSWNLGALPQTLSAPMEGDVDISLLTIPQFPHPILRHDGRPLQVLEIGGRVARARGEVYLVQPLGAMAVIDEEKGTLSWTVIAVASGHPSTDSMGSLADVEGKVPGIGIEIKKWLRKSGIFIGGSDGDGVLAVSSCHALILEAHSAWSDYCGNLGASPDARCQPYKPSTWTSVIGGSMYDSDSASAVDDSASAPTSQTTPSFPSSSTSSTSSTSSSSSSTSSSSSSARLLWSPSQSLSTPSESNPVTFPPPATLEPGAAYDQIWAELLDQEIPTTPTLSISRIPGAHPRRFWKLDPLVEASGKVPNRAAHIRHLSHQLVTYVLGSEEGGGRLPPIATESDSPQKLSADPPSMPPVTPRISPRTRRNFRCPTTVLNLAESEFEALGLSPSSFELKKNVTHNTRHTYTHTIHHPIPKMCRPNLPPPLLSKREKKPNRAPKSTPPLPPMKTAPSSPSPTAPHPCL